MSQDTTLTGCDSKTRSASSGERSTRVTIQQEQAQAVSYHRHLRRLEDGAIDIPSLDILHS